MGTVERLRCKWCGVFIRRDMPLWTWYRAWPQYGQEENGPLGWTEPQRLCPDHAEDAYHWPNCHAGVFAEVAA